MRRDVTAALRLALQGHLSLRKSRLENFAFWLSVSCYPAPSI